jgi:UDP-N-acetylglucosamine--N-acetylmuramyl-(pentapeptide) pyrophosphoryl-undecaprenol N-acetylglucosamine transferase
LPPRCVSPKHTGNPLRSDFSKVSRTTARQELGLKKEDFFILSFGGSRGAERLNDAILYFIKKVLPEHPSLCLLHATGEKHYASCRSALGGAQNGRGSILPYISKMATYMSAADVVICRAGAMTLSELALCGKCAILIPSPHVAGDHQRKNALLFENAHAACIIEENDLPQNKLEKVALSLFNDKQKRAIMEKNIQKMAVLNANEVIWGEIEQLVKKHGQI